MKISLVRQFVTLSISYSLSVLFLVQPSASLGQTPSATPVASPTAAPALPATPVTPAPAGTIASPPLNNQEQKAILDLCASKLGEEGYKRLRTKNLEISYCVNLRCHEGQSAITVPACQGYAEDLQKAASCPTEKANFDEFKKNWNTACDGMEISECLEYAKSCSKVGKEVNTSGEDFTEEDCEALEASPECFPGFGAIEGDKKAEAETDKAKTATNGDKPSGGTNGDAGGNKPTSLPEKLAEIDKQLRDELKQLQEQINAAVKEGRQENLEIDKEYVQYRDSVRKAEAKVEEMKDKKVETCLAIANKKMRDDEARQEALVWGPRKAATANGRLNRGSVTRMNSSKKRELRMRQARRNKIYWASFSDCINNISAEGVSLENQTRRSIAELANTMAMASDMQLILEMRRQNAALNTSETVTAAQQATQTAQQTAQASKQAAQQAELQKQMEEMQKKIQEMIKTQQEKAEKETPQYKANQCMSRLRKYMRGAGTDNFNAKMRQFKKIMTASREATSICANIEESCEANSKEVRDCRSYTSKFNPEKKSGTAQSLNGASAFSSQGQSGKRSGELQTPRADPRRPGKFSIDYYESGSNPFRGRESGGAAK